MAETGVITEQGDLGLGFDPLSQNDQQVVREQQESEKKNQENSQNK